MLSYESKLLKYYSQFSLPFIRYELHMVDGWALLAAAIENDGWLQFAGTVNKTEGGSFIAQEIESLKAEVRHLYTLS